MSESANIREQRRLRREKDRQRRKRRAFIQRIALGGVVLVIAVLLLVTAVKALGKGKEKSEKEQIVSEKQEKDNALVLSEDVGSADADKSAEADILGEADKSDETDKADETDNPGEQQSDENAENTNAEMENVVTRDYSIRQSDTSTYMGSEEMTSAYGLLVKADDMTVVSAKNASDRISPASMTKILTLLVACEHITDPDDTYTVTIEATDYAYSNDCSSVGFSENEVVTVRDLLYGTILPSGGDAAYSLACYVAGSHEAFVDMMNDKLSQLGLSDTAHFTNCVGIYNDNHYCTLEDMAVIMAAAMDNSLAREVLSAHRYTTSSTEQHPEGIDISNLFLRRIEDKDTLGEVIGAKTGYVVQSGNCAASYYTGNDGEDYICVTANAHSAWRAIYDHVAVYNIYAAKNTGYHK